MTQSLQIKLLAAILAVLGVVAGLVIHSRRPSFTLTTEDKQLQHQLEQTTLPSEKPYLEP